ncbi:YdcF family protein [Streptomyces niveiscabiei]|uniref:YdcF family protein n=1 Tax=Streptomyces niveiscabiei TaxID=164115 RepID=UPI00389ADBAB
MPITSGGQGPDADLPEAHAMAAHLIAHGVPETHVVPEDRSRTAAGFWPSMTIRDLPAPPEGRPHGVRAARRAAACVRGVAR